MRPENLWVATATFDYSWNTRGYNDRSSVYRFIKANTQKEAEQYVKDKLFNDPEFEDWGIITLSVVYMKEDTEIEGISDFAMKPVSEFNAIPPDNQSEYDYVDLVRSDEVDRARYEEELLFQKINQDW